MRATPSSLIVPLGVGLALAAVAGCGKGGGPGGGPGGMVVHVVGFRAVEQPVEERVAVVGTLAANESVDIKSELDGAIETIGFAEGERVDEGTVLFRINRTKLEASLAEAEANLRLAETTLERYAALEESRAVSKQEADQARAAFEARRASAELMRAQLQDATVVAPFSGTVGARLISLGQYVTKGEALTSLVDTDIMKVEFSVPERFLSRVAEGQAIEVQLAAYPAERFQGTVYFIDPRVSTETRTVPVKARLPNPDGRLRAGMFANLDLVLQVRKRAVVIPESALLLGGGQASVFVITDGKAQPRPVRLGVRLAGAVEIREGLSAGEVVIIEGTQKVGPGSSVDVRLDERPVEEIVKKP
ncbi:MAG: efflux RND transporter periplasmic adaptor subunit [Candidatus Omnitrophica bacterium]|nr:efflux RND transporter periplasmic adaptor subunit [Candidatus Omnitrophota bacterium]